ncbi:MAG: hypothetical protein WA418_39205 [Bradyrhizobium sp.]
MPKRYVLHPGYVRSAYDGADHFVNTRTLAGLYKVDPRQCLSWYPGMPPVAGVVHLYPRDDGRYELETIGGAGE